MKTTSIHFDLTYYHYYAKLTFFPGCAYEKAEVIDLKRLILFARHVDQAVFLGLQIFAILRKYFYNVTQTNQSVAIFFYLDRIIAEFANNESIIFLKKSKVDNFPKDTKMFFFPLQKTFHVVETHYVAQLSIHYYMCFRQLVLNKGDNCNTYGNSFPYSF